MSTAPHASARIAVLVTAVLIGSVGALLLAEGSYLAAVLCALALGSCAWFSWRIGELSRDALRAAELQSVLDSTSDAVLRLDREGKIRQASREAREILGWSDAELVGREVGTLLVDPAAVARPRSSTELLGEGIRAGVVGYRGNVRHRDGRTVPVRIRLLESGTTSTPFVCVLGDLRDRDERERISSALREIARPLASAIAELRSTAGAEATASGQQARLVAHSLDSITQLAGQSDTAIQHARRLAASSETGGELARSGTQSISAALAALDSARAKTESVALSIAELAEQARTIAELTGLLGDLAEQTHLLGLNAAIEAARAGEQARGFGVAAAEIKALSEQSMHATAQVRDILERIQEGTLRSVHTTGDGAAVLASGRASAELAGGAIARLSAMLGEASSSAHEIVRSSGQQAIASAETREALRSLDGAVQRSLDGARRVERSAATLQALNERIQKVLPADEPAP